MPHEQLIQTASVLLGKKADEVVRTGGGGNSRIYRVRAGEDVYALKMYPTIERDPRDRLGVEKKTLRFFEHNGVSCVPRWLNDCPGHALLSWIEGELANPPSADEMQMAIQFLKRIKELSRLPEATGLPAASEACTSGSQIIVQIEKRLERLQEITGTEPALAQFLARGFMPAFTAAYAAVKEEYAKNGIGFDAPLSSGSCLIPADFGFHNAMRSPDGALTFIDFEYFGWDDPVKLTADFLLHPAMQLPRALREQFHAQMVTLFSDDPCFAVRLRALTPLFALRWALIMLNEFLPERWSGRAFAQGENEWAAAKERQLDKAANMLKYVTQEKFYA